MSTKIPVSELYRYLQMMLDDEWGYIWGTAGEKWTAEKQKNLESRYDADDPNRGMSVRYGAKWIGHRVADCSGVLVFIYKQFGLTIPHGSSSMVRQKYIVDCGPTPHPGWAALVDPTPDTPDNRHIGVVGPDGKTVFESKGTRAGFTTSLVTDKKWSKFGRLKDVDYESSVSFVDGASADVRTEESRREQPMADESGERVYYRAEVTTKTGRLNVRTGPSTDDEIIGHLAKGHVVDVMFKYPSGWCYVDDDGDQGYVLGSFLTPLPPSGAYKEDSGNEQLTPDKKTALRRNDDIVIILDGEWAIDHIIGGDD